MTASKINFFKATFFYKYLSFAKNVQSRIFRAKFCLAAAATLLASCSLTYRTQPQNVEDTVPDLTFGGTKFSRYEDRKKTLVFNAEKIEQYNGGKFMYAQGVSFSIFDKEGSLDSSGECGLLGIDRNAGIYELFDGIKITNTKREIVMTADTLKWNEKTEQLTGSDTGQVSVTKNNTTLSGSGFSASAISNQFAFQKKVSGLVVTEDDEKPETQNGSPKVEE